MIPLKKSLQRILIILCGVIAGAIISSVLFALTGFSLFGRVREETAPLAETTNAELTSLAYRIVNYIKTGDYSALSYVAHPEFGVVFSPRATVTLSTNRCFSPEQIAAFGADTNTYVWGIRNGSGEPIEMTPADYFAAYIFDKDYSEAALIGVNQIVRSGNALENITDVFPDVKFVDFYVAGGDRESAEGLSWSSLRMGFEEFEGSLMLTVIVHSEWTE